MTPYIDTNALLTNIGGALVSLVEEIESNTFLDWLDKQPYDVQLDYFELMSERGLTALDPKVHAVFIAESFAKSAPAFFENIGKKVAELAHDYVQVGV